MSNSVCRPSSGGKDKAQTRGKSKRLISVYVLVSIGFLSLAIGAFVLAYNVCGWKGVLMGRSFLWFWYNGYCN